MNQDTNTQVVPQVKPIAKYRQQQAARQRYSFGNVWLNAVLAGVVSDKDKLVAHAVALKAGKKSDLKRIKFDTLLAKVQRAVMTDTTATSA